MANQYVVQKSGLVNDVVTAHHRLHGELVGDFVAGVLGTVCCRYVCQLFLYLLANVNHRKTAVFKLLQVTRLVLMAFFLNELSVFGVVGFGEFLSEVADVECRQVRSLDEVAQVGCGVKNGVFVFLHLVIIKTS